MIFHDPPPVEALDLGWSPRKKINSRKTFFLDCICQKPIYTIFSKKADVKAAKNHLE